MQIVNINDIEELVIAKYEIEKIRLANKEIEKKATINEFLINDAKLDYIYRYKGISIPFNFKKINNEDYLFIATNNKQHIDILINKIKLIKYDINNLVKLSNEETLKMENIDEEEFVIYNNAYYK